MLAIKHISVITKNSVLAWFSAFAALCLSFSPLLFNFIWGNHDWLPLISGNPVASGLIEGRFSQYLLLNLLLMGQIFPLLNLLFGFAFYALALVLLCRFFFKFTAPLFTTMLFIAVTAALPYTCEVLYFQFIAFSLLSWPLIIAAALILALKAPDAHPMRNTAFSAILLFLALGGYPPAANLFVTAVACRLLLDISNPAISLKKLCLSAIPYIVSLAIALAGLKLVFCYLQKEHLMMVMYNSEVQTPWELLFKIPDTLKNALFGFIRPQPFFPPAFKILTAALALIFALKYLAVTHNSRRLCLGFAAISFLLLCLKFSAWLAKAPLNNAFTVNDPPYFMVRADFFAFPIFTLFSLFFLYHRRPLWLKNLALALALALLWQSLALNLSFSKTHLLGFTAENQLLERLVSRIQNHPEYDPTAQYTVVQAGELPLRHRYASPMPKNKSGYYTLKVPYSRHWIAFEYYNFYAPEDFVRSGTFIAPEHITPAMVGFLTRRITPWPSPESLYLDTRYAIISLTPEGKNMLTGQFNQLNGKLP